LRASCLCGLTPAIDPNERRSLYSAAADADAVVTLRIIYGRE